MASTAAELIIDMAAGKQMEETSSIFDGMYDIPSIFLEPIAVTKENMDATVISEGFHLREDVYLNADKTRQ